MARKWVSTNHWKPPVVDNSKLTHARGGCGERPTSANPDRVTCARCIAP